MRLGESATMAAGKFRFFVTHVVLDLCHPSATHSAQNKINSHRDNEISLMLEGASTWPQRVKRRIRKRTKQALRFPLRTALGCGAAGTLTILVWFAAALTSQGHAATCLWSLEITWSKLFTD